MIAGERKKEVAKLGQSLEYNPQISQRCRKRDSKRKYAQGKQ